MYYVFIPSICICLFFGICISISKDCSKKFLSLDYKSGFFHRSDRSIERYIEDIESLQERTNSSFFTKTLPPYSDYSVYNILYNQDKDSVLLDNLDK